MMKRKIYFAGIGFALMAALCISVLWRKIDEKGYKAKSVPVIHTEYNKNVESKYVEESLEEVLTKEEKYGEIIRKILEENREEITAFFEQYPSLWQRWIDFSCFDFTGKGEMEIIFSYSYVETTGVISYNCVYDAEGSKLFECVSENIYNLEIYAGEDSDTFYMQNHINIAAGLDVTFYQEISREEDWNVEVVYMEWDCRDGKARNENEKEGYDIYDNFTPEEKAVLMKKNYTEGMVKVCNEKEANGDAEQLSRYIQIYENMGKSRVVYLGYVNDLEEGMNWYTE